jgi:hypothetical protein
MDTHWSECTGELRERLKREQEAEPPAAKAQPLAKASPPNMFPRLQLFPKWGNLSKKAKLNDLFGALDAVATTASTSSSGTTNSSTSSTIEATTAHGASTKEGN